MKQNDTHTWIDDALSAHLKKQTDAFDFQRWRNRFPEEAQRLGEMRQTEGQTILWSQIWRIIMKSPYTKYGTVAAGLLIAVMFLFPGGNGITPDSVLWADVQEQLQEKGTIRVSGTKTFTCLDSESCPGHVCQVIKYGSREYGYYEQIYLEDVLVFEIYLNRASRIVTLISHEQQKYFHFKVPEEFMKNLDIISVQGVLDCFTTGDVENIGLQTIRGQKVVGFERKGDTWFTEEIDSKIMNFLFPINESTMRVWIDPETSLPVFAEVEMEIGKGVANGFHEMRLEEFLDEVQWDVELDESMFIPVVPEDYQIFGMPELKKTAVVGVTGTAAAVPLIFWLRKRRKRKSA